MTEIEIKMSEKELLKYILLSEKLMEIAKGETYDDVEKAVESLMQSLKRRSIVN